MTASIYTVHLRAALAEAQTQRLLAESRRIAAVESERRSREFQYATDIMLANHALQAANVRQAVDLLRRQIPADNSEDRRSFAWHYLWNLCHRESRSLKRPWRRGLSRGHISRWKDDRQRQRGWDDAALGFGKRTRAGHLSGPFR